MRVLDDRVDGEPAAAAARATHHADLGLERERLLQHARHRAQHAPRRPHLRRVGHEPLALAVVAEAGGLQDRRVSDRRVGVERVDHGARPDRQPGVGEERLLPDAVLGDRDGLGRRRARACGGRAVAATPPAGSRTRSSRRRSGRRARSARPRRRSGAVDARSATAVAGPPGRGRAPRCGTPSSAPRSARTRPSCPPPSMPIIAGGSTTLGVTARRQHRGRGLAASLVAVRSQRGGEGGVVGGEHRDREERGVGGAGLADRERRDGDAGRASARSTAASPARDRWRVATGTPSTGTIVFAESMPGRCAAPRRRR